MADYDLLREQASSIIETEPHYVAALSNIAALIYESMEQLNWAGFYLMDRGSLLVGPFQGKTACTVIEAGKGVCGTAAAEDRTQLVPDVHEFPGHIACDSASRSELVVPLHRKGELYGVLDIDSPSKGRFTESDREVIEGFTHTLEAALDRLKTDR